MADLGHLLELLSREPKERFVTAEAEYDFEVDLTVSEVVTHELAATSPGTQAPIQRRTTTGDERELTGTIHVWSQPPHHVRVDYSSPLRHSRAVRDENGWLIRDQEAVAWRSGSFPLGQAALLMLNPAVLLGVWSWTVCESRPPDGAYTRAFAVRRSFTDDQPWLMRVCRPFGLGADSWSIVVAKNGTLTRVEACFRGSPYVTHKTAQAAFDQPLPQGVFNLVT
jgi:hypothetical protein